MFTAKGAKDAKEIDFAADFADERGFDAAIDALFLSCSFFRSMTAKLLHLCFHVLAQQCINRRLISLALAPEKGQHFTV
jgi:hypothetical protein